MQKQKAIKRTKHIKANAINLVDSEGRTRIFMDANGSDGSAYILLYGKDKKCIQISSDADGMIGIHLDGSKNAGLINISISKDDSAVISTFDKNGLQGTALAEEPGTSTHRLLLFKNGKHFWNTPSGKKLNHLKIGDTIRVNKYRPRKYAPGVKDEDGTEKLFKSMVGRRYKIKGIDEYGNIELKPKRLHTVWIEPDLVELVKE
jgi:hypothetical protein